jgi:NAD(P)-dependent dehydrogenase (short-subunit alcohol dehydrogenase family)
MAISMDGKVAIVTGAGGGLGREFALALAAAGAKVVVNDIGATLSGEGRDSGPADAVVSEILARGGDAVSSTESVAEWESASRMVESAITHFGRLDIIVNNAGILRDRLFHKMTPDDWKAVIDVHLNGSFYVSRAAAGHFRQQNSGSFVHMTSTSGLIGNIGQANYGAAKAGIAALSHTIASDMARFGVRSNCIAPFAWSRMINSIPVDTPAQQARVAALKLMDAGKVAPLAVYLASEAAARVTGQIFSVRANEIFLMGQSRPLRSVHRSEGWTVDSIDQHAIPALQANFYPLEKSADVFSWEPI